MFLISALGSLRLSINHYLSNLERAYVHSDRELAWCLSYFSVAVKSTMTKATYRRRVYWGCLQFQRIGVYDHHGREHGTKSVLRNHTLIHKHEAERELTGNGWAL